MIINLISVDISSGISSLGSGIFGLVFSSATILFISLNETSLKGYFPINNS